MNQLAPTLAFGGACNEIEAINVRALGGARHDHRQRPNWN